MEYLLANLHEKTAVALNARAAPTIIRFKTKLMGLWNQDTPLVLFEIKKHASYAQLLRCENSHFSRFLDNSIQPGKESHVMQVI